MIGKKSEEDTNTNRRADNYGHGYYNTPSSLEVDQKKVSYTESRILKDDEVLKSLVTPEIVRTNEPNEVLVEIFAGDYKLVNSIIYVSLLQQSHFLTSQMEKFVPL